MSCYSICKICEWWWDSRIFFIYCKEQTEAKAKTFVMFSLLSANKEFVLEEMCWHLCWWGPKNAWFHESFYISLNERKSWGSHNNAFFLEKCWWQKYLKVKFSKSFERCYKNPLLNKDQFYLRLVLKMDVQMGVKEHINLLHTEIQWVNRGAVLNKVFQQRGELKDALKKIVDLIQWRISR